MLFSPLSPLSSTFNFSGNTLTKSHRRPSHPTGASFLPFDLPSRLTDAFDLPTPKSGGMKADSYRYVDSIETLGAYDKEESFSPFGERTGRVMSMGFGFKKKAKKEKRGTMVLPILHPAPSGSPYAPSSRTVTPAESIDSLSSSFSGRTSVQAKVIPRVRPPRVDEEVSTTPSTISHRPPPRPPRPSPNPQSMTEDDKAIAALERLSHHLLAENKIPGYRHPPGDAYDRTRAVPRVRKPSFALPAEGNDGYIMVTHPAPSKGKAAVGGYIKTSDRQEAEARAAAAEARERESSQSASLRGWRKLRPTSSGGTKKDRPVSEGLGHRRTLSRADSGQAPEGALPPVPPLSQAAVGGGRMGRGITRMRSISSTRLTANLSISELSHQHTGSTQPDIAPPIPPRATSRPNPVRYSANSAQTGLTDMTGVYVPLVLSPSREDVGEVRATVPRSALRDSMNSRTGTEVTLMSPRSTPIQLTPLPPPLPLPLPPTSSSNSPNPAITSTPGRKNSLHLSSGPSRFSKLRIKRALPDSLNIVPPTPRGRSSTVHSLAPSRTSTQSRGDGDSIVEEGLRVLEEVRKAERMEPRVEPRAGRARVSAGPAASASAADSGADIGGAGTGMLSGTEKLKDEPTSRDVDSLSSGGTRRNAQKRMGMGGLGGMTALSFLAMDEDEDEDDLPLSPTEATEGGGKLRISESDENHTNAGYNLPPRPYLPYPHPSNSSSPAQGTQLPRVRAYNQSTHHTTHSHPSHFPGPSLTASHATGTRGATGTYTITHIIPPGERNLIGPAPLSPSSAHSPRRYTRDSISSIDDESASPGSPSPKGRTSAKRRSQIMEYSRKPLPPTSHLTIQLPTSPYAGWSFHSSSGRGGGGGAGDGGLPTALSPPPRSRKMTGRAGSAGGLQSPAVPQYGALGGLGSGLLRPYGQGQGMGQGQGQRSLSLGALSPGGMAGGTVSRGQGAGRSHVNWGENTTISPTTYTQPGLANPSGPTSPKSARASLREEEGEGEDEDGVEPLYSPSKLSYYRRSSRVVYRRTEERSELGEDEGEGVSDKSMELVLLGEFGAGGAGGERRGSGAS